MSRTNQSIEINEGYDSDVGYTGEGYEIIPKYVKNEPTEFDPTPRVLLIDLDSIGYSVIHFPETGTVHFDTDEEYIEEAKHRMREKIQEIHNNVEKWFNITDTFAFQGSSGNFRYKITSTYKNKRPKEKPKYLKEVKQYAFDELGAIDCKGFEADDAIYESWLSSNKQCLIAAIDKDIRYHCWGVPVYDFKTRKDVMGEFKTPITEKQSRLAVATQYLIGDMGDSVGGAAGIGIKYAEKHLHEDMTDYQFIRAILTGYLKASKGNMEEAKKNCRLTYSLLRLYTQDEIKSLNLDKI